MTVFLTWQGSEVRQVEAKGGTVRVLFSAASSRRAGTAESAPQRPCGEGFLKPLAVAFTKAHVQGDLGSALGTLAKGVLHHAGHPHRQLALPFSLSSGVHAELVFLNGTVVQIKADAALCTLDTDSQFFESMAC